jgi:hypothetical protein
MALCSVYREVDQAAPRDSGREIAMLSAEQITQLHDELVGSWHQKSGFDTLGPHDPILALVARQHRANFELWHIEDEARRPGATDAELADVKRRIDRTNQRRNDAVEELDQALLHALVTRGLPNPEAELHSETPGLMIDRLSILALKIYHTREETCRENAPVGHVARCTERLAILEQQRADLAGCLGGLWNEILAGKRRFKLYRQLKMYNDPSLNPAIYGKLPK